MFLAAYLLYDRQAKVKIATSTKQNVAGETAPQPSSEAFFQKPGSEQTTSTPAVTQTKSVAELEQVAQSQASTPADYNLLASAYHQKGDQDKALQVINDGLAKYPGDNSLLLTKDLIENPNL